MRRFFSFEARITRLRLLLGIVVGLAIGWSGVLILREMNGVATILVGAAAGVTIAKLVVEAGRRRHDMGLSATGAIAALGFGIAAIGATTVYALGTGSDLPQYAVSAAFLLAWVVLLLRPGATTANNYGPPPRALLPSFMTSPVRNGGLLVGILLTLSGAAMGFGANLWIEGMARHNERGQAIAENAAAMDDAPTNLELEYREQTR